MQGKKIQEGCAKTKKEKIKKIVYEWYYLIYYSVKDIFIGVGDGLIEFKKPRTWLAVLIAASILILYSRRLYLLYWVIPPLIVVYILRHYIDGHYRHDMREWAMKKDKDYILRDEYNKYVKKCHYINRAPFDYEYWKNEERKKLTP